MITYIYIHTDIDTEREGGITWYERESLDCSYGVMGDLYNGCSEEWKQWKNRPFFQLFRKMKLLFNYHK